MVSSPKVKKPGQGQGRPAGKNIDGGKKLLIKGEKEQAREGERSIKSCVPKARSIFFFFSSFLKK